MKPVVTSVKENDTAEVTFINELQLIGRIIHDPIGFVARNPNSWGNNDVIESSVSSMGIGTEIAVRVGWVQCLHRPVRNNFWTRSGLVGIYPDQQTVGRIGLPTPG